MCLTSILMTALVALLAQAGDSPANSFKELGSLFLWGMVGAVGLALVVAFVLVKVQGRRAASSNYVSINPANQSNQDLRVRDEM
jgi:hypothetical protein